MSRSARCARLRLDDRSPAPALGGTLLQGDLGLSLMMDRPIGPLIGDAILRSAVLAGVSLVFVAVVGIWLGVFTAVRKDSKTDHAVSVGMYFFISVPEFFWAIVMILLFAGYLGWLPATGYAPMSDLLDLVEHHPAGGDAGDGAGGAQRASRSSMSGPCSHST
jgi:ABC-type dipeptide/oligopeptide/nickel transport system permease component